MCIPQMQDSFRTVSVKNLDLRGSLTIGETSENSEARL